MKLGVSACVLGDPVRYDGGHKYSSFCVEQLQQVNWLKLCPEVLAGMGVPRPTLHLQQGASSRAGREPVQAVVTTTGEEVSDRLTTVVDQFEHQLRCIDGYVFCTRSPSCGVDSAPLLDANTGAQVGTTSGVFAARLRQRFPALPVIESIALEKPLLANNFLMRASIYRAWQQFKQAPNLADLDRFTENLQPLLQFSAKAEPLKYEQLKASEHFLRLGIDQQAQQQRYSEQLMALLEPLMKPEHAATVARYIQLQ